MKQQLIENKNEQTSAHRPWKWAAKFKETLKQQTKRNTHKNTSSAHTELTI